MHISCERKDLIVDILVIVTTTLARPSSESIIVVRKERRKRVYQPQIFKLWTNW